MFPRPETLMHDERVWVVFGDNGEPRFVSDSAETAQGFASGYGSKKIGEYVIASKLGEYQAELQRHCGCEFEEQTSDGITRSVNVVECLVHRNVRIGIESRPGRTEEQNRSLRAWIRELRDTQEERGQDAADPLYSMLLDRINPLVEADPAADSADGIRLVALTELCEAYEKRDVERHAHTFRRDGTCECGATPAMPYDPTV